MKTHQLAKNLSLATTVGSTKRFIGPQCNGLLIQADSTAVLANAHLVVLRVSYGGKSIYNASLLPIVAMNMLAGGCVQHADELHLYLPFGNIGLGGQELNVELYNGFGTTTLFDLTIVYDQPLAVPGFYYEYHTDAEFTIRNTNLILLLGSAMDEHAGTVQLTGGGADQLIKISDANIMFNAAHPQALQKTYSLAYKGPLISKSEVLLDIAGGTATTIMIAGIGSIPDRRTVNSGLTAAQASINYGIAGRV